MNTYRICGLTLASGIPLPELPEAEAPGSDCSFDLADSAELGGEAIEWFHSWPLPDGGIWLAFGRRDGEYVLRFPARADFVVCAGGRQVRCRPAPGVPEATIRHLLLDQVIPLVISHRGRVVLHASAVRTPAGAIGFVGSAGQGKSTLGAALSKDGCPALTDDALAIEERLGGLVALPSYPGLRLWPEQAAALFDDARELEAVADYTEKRRLGPRRGHASFSQSPSPLCRLYLLSPKEAGNGLAGARFTPLGPRETVMALIAHSYHLDITDTARLGQELHLLSQIASRRLCYELAYPRDLALLESVRAAILDHLGRAG